MTTAGRRTSDAIVRICLFGSVRLFANGRPVDVRPGGRTEALLGSLALRARSGVPREELLGLVWPDSESGLASQSLNTLLYSLRKRFAAALPSRAAILEESGRYRLNIDAGIRIDVLEFDAAVEAGNDSLRRGDVPVAVDRYEEALALYTGDLAVGSNFQHLVERERLRARFLAARAHVADHHFAQSDYEEALRNALELLVRDPCREDAHRMVMRCHVRLGARAQAIRQYRICRQIIADEFDAEPEPATEALVEQIRLDPGRV